MYLHWLITANLLVINYQQMQQKDIAILLESKLSESANKINYYCFYYTGKYLLSVGLYKNALAFACIYFY